MKNEAVTLSPAICATCNGTGIEYDGAGHTCTACNGEPVPPVCCAPTAEEQAVLANGDYTPEELWGGSRPTCPKCHKEPAPPAGGEVEVVTAAWLDLSKLDKGSMAYATAMKVNHRQTELVDRAHITRLQAEVGRLKDEAGIYRTGYALLKEELTKARECLKDLGVDWSEVSDMYRSAKDESHEE